MTRTHAGLLARLRRNRAATERAKTERTALFQEGRELGLTSDEMSEAAGVRPITVRQVLARARQARRG